MEEWKEYWYWYHVSNLWNVKKLINWIFHNRKHSPNAPWYRQISLAIQWKRKTVLVHRMVASLFIKNPYNYNVVNHINWIKYDNKAENLEWCTQKMNNIHARKMWLQWEWVYDPYLQYDKDMKLLARYKSLSEAHLATWISRWRLWYAKRWWGFHTWFYWKNK